MPAPFRKACKCCAALKRRCDLAVPRCSRCESRSLECLYEGIVPVEAGADLWTDMATTMTPFVPAGSAYSTDVASSTVQSTISPATGNEPENCLLNLSPAQDIDWSNLMTHMEDFAVPDIISVHPSPELGVLEGEIYQGRIIYCVKHLQTFPAQFVQKFHTPFINKSLYQEHFPLVLQDALAVSALYTQRTAHNEPAVHRVISENGNRILNAWSLPGPSALDQLATAQSLVMLQIIRLFDGSIRLRSDAELADATLSAMLKQLRSRMQNAADEANNASRVPSGDYQTTWQNWLFSESLRRTVIVGYAIQGLYCFLQHGWDNSHHEFQSLSFFGQRALWDAQSEYQWTTATKERLSLPLRFSSWDEDAVNLQPADIDELGMTMMVLIKGVDPCSHWIGQDLTVQVWHSPQA